MTNIIKQYNQGNMEDSLILIGGGGHCKACIDVIESSGLYKIAGIVDKPDKIGNDILGYKIIGNDENLPDLIGNYKNVLITIGQIQNHHKRLEIFESAKRLKGHFPTIVSKFAYVSTHAIVDEGTIIMHNALINARASIGKNCIINTKALIEHDARIEDHCHISTGVIINGGCRIAKKTFIGSGSITKQGIKIGEGSIIGAGSIVINDIPDHTLAFGNPAVIIDNIQVTKCKIGKKLP